MGQMSLWGATVITNLMSAIPYIGMDVVEFTNNDIELTLPTIGAIAHYSIKDPNKKHIKQRSLEIPKSFMELFLGYVDGDGYISITSAGKTNNYIKMTLTINVSSVEETTLNHFKDVLGVGTISKYTHNNSTFTKYVINKTDLQYIIFPLLKRHDLYFLTETRRQQYNKALYIMNNNIKVHDDIPDTIPNLLPTYSSSQDYLALPFFNNWLVGFTMAEGSFLMKKNGDGCFQITQRAHPCLFESIELCLKTDRKSTTHTEGKYDLYSVSSIKDIQNVINFFSFNDNMPLIGYQSIRYLQWLGRLKESNRYKDLKYPNTL